MYVIKYLEYIRDVKVVTETARRLATPFMSILFAYYLIQFEYQVIGQILFGGSITYAEGWTLADAAGGDGINLTMNCNDYMNCCQTLVAMLVTNNWNDITDAF